MRYTAAALSAATRPVVLTIGRASDRRGWRRLSRWWVRTARTWTARPLSVPQMLALQAVRGDPAGYVAVMRGLIRAALPWRWRYVVYGDPLRLLFRLPPALLGRVLKALVTVPETDRDVSQETGNLIEEIRRAQRRAVYGDRDDTVSLAVAALSVRAVYGDGWYWNPARWPTTDGYVPFAVALVEAAGVQALDVRRRLEVADGMSLAHAKDPQRARRQMQTMAYPTEVC